MQYTIEIDDDLDSPALRQELNRVTALALQAARERFYSKGQIFGRGYNGNAVSATEDLRSKQAAEFEKNFGRKP